MKLKSLPFLVKYISDVDATYNFWQSLGIEIKEHSEDKVVINLSELEIHYVHEATEPFEEYQFAIEKEGRGLGSLIYIEVDDLENFYKKVKEANPKKLTEIKENHWDGREFLFSDPDGFLFVVYSV